MWRMKVEVFNQFLDKHEIRMFDFIDQINLEGNKEIKARMLKKGDKFVTYIRNFNTQYENEYLYCEVKDIKILDYIMTNDNLENYLPPDKYDYEIKHCDMLDKDEYWADMMGIEPNKYNILN
jgi:hypothetical protein